MPDPQNEHWLTYAELGELLNCSASAARMHARRRGWQRRTANMIGEPTRVLVPGDASNAGIQRRGDQRTRVERSGPRMFRAIDGQDEANSTAVAVLREQLVIANRRIDELGKERRADAEERRRLLAMLGDLVDARAAAEISRNLVASLQRELDSLRARRPWWRRWFR